MRSTKDDAHRRILPRNEIHKLEQALVEEILLYNGESWDFERNAPRLKNQEGRAQVREIVIETSNENPEPSVLMGVFLTCMMKYL